MQCTSSEIVRQVRLFERLEILYLEVMLSRLLMGCTWSWDVLDVTCLEFNHYV